MPKYRWADTTTLRQEGFSPMDFDAVVRIAGSHNLDAAAREEGDVLIEEEPASAMPVDPLVFRTFAELTSMDDILAFATRHGLLAGTWWEGLGAVLKLEPLALWQDEIRAMIAALELWDASFNEDSDKALREQFQPDAQGVIVAERRGVRRISNRDRFLLPDDHPRRTPFGHNDFRLAARMMASRIADRYLEGRLNASVEWVPEGESYLARRRENARSLAGVLWLQVQQAIVEGTSYARCTQCGRWMEITREARAKTTKLYCSDACRAKAYRERRAGGTVETTKIHNKQKGKAKK